MLCRVFGGARSFVTFAWCWLAYVIFVVMQVASLTATEFATNLLDVVVSPTGGFPPTMVCMDWHVCLFICNRVCDTISPMDTNWYTHTYTHTHTDRQHTHKIYPRSVWYTIKLVTQLTLPPLLFSVQCTWVCEDWHLLRFYEGLTSTALLWRTDIYCISISRVNIYLLCFN